MSVDYGFHLAVGFVFDPRDFFPFADDFTPFADDGIEDATYILGRKKYDGLDEFLAALCKKLRCRYGTCSDHGTTTLVVITPKLPETVGPGMDDGGVWSSSGFDFDKVVRLKPGLDSLRRKLVDIGLKPGKPQVRITWEIG